MERLFDIRARVEKLAQLLACDRGSVLQAWLAQRAAQSAVQLTAFAGLRLTARPLTAGAAWYIMRTDAQRWSFPSVKPHDFQHFVGTKLAKRDLHLTQKALGQKHLETTAQHDGLNELQDGLTDGWY